MSNSIVEKLKIELQTPNKVMNPYIGNVCCVKVSFDTAEFGLKWNRVGEYFPTRDQAILALIDYYSGRFAPEIRVCAFDERFEGQIFGSCFASK